MELWFHPNGTKVSSEWNCGFIRLKLEFHPHETFVSSEKFFISFLYRIFNGNIKTY